MVANAAQRGSFVETIVSRSWFVSQISRVERLVREEDSRGKDPWFRCLTVRGGSYAVVRGTGTEFSRVGVSVNGGRSLVPGQA